MVLEDDGALRLGRMRGQHQLDAACAAAPPRSDRRSRPRSRNCSRHLSPQRLHGRRGRARPRWSAAAGSAAFCSTMLEQVKRDRVRLRQPLGRYRIVAAAAARGAPGELARQRRAPALPRGPRTSSPSGTRGRVRPSRDRASESATGSVGSRARPTQRACRSGSAGDESAPRARFHDIPVRCSDRPAPRYNERCHERDRAAALQNPALKMDDDETHRHSDRRRRHARAERHHSRRRRARQPAADRNLRAHQGLQLPVQPARAARPPESAVSGNPRARSDQGRHAHRLVARLRRPGQEGGARPDLVASARSSASRG